MLSNKQHNDILGCCNNDTNTDAGDSHSIPAAQVTSDYSQSYDPYATMKVATPHSVYNEHYFLPFS